MSKSQEGNPRFVFIREEEIQGIDCIDCGNRHCIMRRWYQDKKRSTDKQDYIIETSVLTGCYEYDPFLDPEYDADRLPNVSRGIRKA